MPTAGDETTGLGVAGALLGGELVSAVRCAYRDCKAVAARAAYEVDHLLGVGVGVVVGAYFVFNACKHAELSLYGHVILMCVVYDFLCQATFSS